MEITNDRIVREEECRQLTGLCRTTRYMMEKEGTFPKKVRIGNRASGWRLSDIQAWIKNTDNVISQGSVSKLLTNIERLEGAARRGLQINENIKPYIDKGEVVSVEYCNATLKLCTLFRGWVNEYLE